jgi:uncharacterized membrane protein
VSLYDGLKFIHVLAAIGWVGAALLSQVSGAWVQRKDDPQAFLNFAEFQAFIGPRYFAPLALTAVASGVGMVVNSGWNFSDEWIIIGLVLWAITFATGAGYFRVENERIRAGLTAGGPPDAALQARIQRLVLVTRIDLVVLVLIVADMVIKPGT